MFYIFLRSVRYYAYPPYITAVFKLYLFGLIQNKLLYFLLNAVRKLKARAGKKLYSVILHRIMRSGNHNSRVRVMRFHKICYGGSGHHPQKLNVNAYRSNSSYKSRLQHIGGDSRIFSYYNIGFGIIGFMPCKHRCPGPHG